MKHTKKIIGFSLALIMFAGVFMSHQNRYNLFTSLVDPFDFENFSGTVEIPLEGVQRTLKYTNGEVIVVAPGSNLEISKEKKELINGSTFLSGALVSLDIQQQYLAQNMFLKAKALGDQAGGASINTGLLATGSPEWVLQMLSAESGVSLGGVDLIRELNSESINSEVVVLNKEAYDYDPGRVFVGPLEIKYPYSAVYIERDSERKQTIIYALGGGVEIGYQGVKNPFVIPSNHRATILDVLISDRTSQLYYTKLQKSFRLEPFDIAIPELGREVVLEQEAPMDFISQAWLIQEEWRKQMRAYIETAHKTLISTTRQSGIQPLVDIITEGQKKFAIGYPESKKDMDYYEETLEPLVKYISQLSTRNAEGDSIGSNLGSLYTTLHSSRWRNLMSQYGDLGRAWNDFYVSHQAATRLLPTSDRLYQFFDYWNNLSSLDSLEKIQKLFLESQLLDLMGEKVIAKSYLERIHETLKKKDFPTQAREDVTNLRRGFGKILKSSSFYQTIELFEVFESLSLAEIDFYKNEEEVNREIRLEVARDALAFLTSFVDKGTNEDASNILLRIYKSMNVKEIQEALNRDIFSAKEIEMISFIDQLGTSRITPEEIERIKETLLIQAELQRIDEELDSYEEEEVPVVVVDPDLIDEEGDLISFFNDLELDTFKLVVLKSNDEELSFKNLFYNQQSIAGVFNINRQQFETIRTDVLERENIRRSLFESVLNEINFINEQKEKEQVRENNQNTPVINISQNDRIALVYRERAVNVLIRNKVQANLSSVLVADKEYKTFMVKEVSIVDGEREIQVPSFILDLESQLVTELVLNTSSGVEAGSPIPLAELRNVLSQ